MTVICRLLAMVLAAGVMATSFAGAQTLPARKNIDLLTPDELSAYEHAIQILMDRSAKNPFDKGGFLWQAWVHNCLFIWVPEGGVGEPGSHNQHCDDVRDFPGAGFVESHPGVCEHGKDLFLPWHRAEFYYFEKLLQASDPQGTLTDSRGKTGPGTATVAVPFWNWTREPSGVRYPKAFENPDSPLFHKERIQTALTDEEKQDFKEMTSPSAIAALVYGDWEEMGGFSQEASVGGFGDFESAHHNLMHFHYFGPDSHMASPPTAALDPAFFSFHAYIDLVYEFWLEQHGPASITSQRHFLRAEQPADVPPPTGFEQGAGEPTMGRAGIYHSIEALGYTYEVTAEDRLPEPPTVAALLADTDGAPALFAMTERSAVARLSGDGLFDPAGGRPVEIIEVPVPIPASAANVHAAFSRPEHAPDVSFAIDFYLHPDGETFDIAHQADRRRFIVARKGYWGSGEALHGSHGPDKPLFADLSNSIADLVATGHGGEVWKLTAVVSVAEDAALSDQPFGALKLVE